MNANETVQRLDTAISRFSLPSVSEEIALLVQEELPKFPFDPELQIDKGALPKTAEDCTFCCAMFGIDEAVLERRLHLRAQFDRQIDLVEQRLQSLSSECGVISEIWLEHDKAQRRLVIYVQSVDQKHVAWIDSLLKSDSALSNLLKRNGVIDSFLLQVTDAINGHFFDGLINWSGEATRAVVRAAA